VPGLTGLAVTMAALVAASLTSGVGAAAPRAALPAYVRDLATPAPADVTPVDVAVSPSHYYVLDVARYRVVRIDRATGTIDRVAGGTRGSGPGQLMASRSLARASNGDVYVADTSNNRVTVYDADLRYKLAFGSKGAGPGRFTQVYGVAVGSARVAGVSREVVYTVDGDGRIQRWTPGGTLLGAFATGVRLDRPRMAEVHPVTRDLWVVSTGDRNVVVIDENGNQRFRFGAGGGSGPGQFRNDPRGLAIDPEGKRVFVSDDGNHRVQVFSSTGDYLTQVRGTPGSPSYLVDPRGVAVTETGLLVLCDQWAWAVKEYDATSTGLARRLFGAAPRVGGVNTPRGLATDGSGRVFVSDWWNQRIGRWAADGSAPFAFGFRGTTSEPGSINFAWDVAVQPGSGRLFVANRESHEVEVLTGDGGYVARWGKPGTAPGQFRFTHGVAFAPDGTLLVTDSGNGRVQRFRIDSAGEGAVTAVYGAPGTAVGRFAVPTGVTVTRDGAVWVADTGNDRVQRRDPVTGSWTAFTSPAAGQTPYRRPWGVTADADGTVWVADSGNGRIVHLDRAGTALAVATGPQLGAGRLASPFDVLPTADGRLLVSDTFNNRIVELRR
jgi:tripartite motif-containing protein 71